MVSTVPTEVRTKNPSGLRSFWVRLPAPAPFLPHDLLFTLIVERGEGSLGLGDLREQFVS